MGSVSPTTAASSDSTAENSADAIVIGAGVIGASIALELARSGRSVIVVDKGPAVGAGSTSSSSAIIRFSYSTADSVITAWESAWLWRSWEAHLGGADPDGLARFVETGMLILNTPGDATVRIARLWDELGIAYESLDSEALQRRLPGLDIGSFFPPKPIDDPSFADDATTTLTAIFEPESGFVDDPMLAARNLAFAARRHGAQFRFHAEVVSVDRTTDGERVAGVTLADGRVLRAPIVVNVAGPHSPRLNAMAGIDGTMRVHNRALRQEVFTVEAPNGLRLDDHMPAMADLDIGQYVKPQPGGTWLVGGTEPECDELEWIDDPDSFVDHPTLPRWETAMLRVARRAPNFGVPNRPVGLAALYDVSDDWMPIYDKTDLPGFFMACGTSGNQFKNAPLVGQFLVAIIEAAQNGIDHDRDPVQFRGTRTGRTINLGAFSRLRDLATTSGSVMG